MHLRHHSRASLQNGFSVVEIVVVAGIISLVFLSISQLMVVATRPVAAASRHAHATYLAEEAVEAVRSMRNEGWTSTIAPLTTGTTYYPLLSAGRWSLSVTNPGALDGTFQRTVVLQPVYRDGDDNISATGTLDPNTMNIVVTVSWAEHQQNKTVTIETYLTNFLNS